MLLVIYSQTKNGAKRIIQTGSHLDTVPSGGNYDGVVGVVGGLEAIKSIMGKRST